MPRFSQWVINLIDGFLLQLKERGKFLKSDNEYGREFKKKLRPFNEERIKYVIDYIIYKMEIGLRETSLSWIDEQESNMLYIAHVELQEKSNPKYSFYLDRIRKVKAMEFASGFDSPKFKHDEDMVVLSRLEKVYEDNLKYLKVAKTPKTIILYNILDLYKSITYYADLRGWQFPQLRERIEGDFGEGKDRQGEYRQYAKKYLLLLLENIDEMRELSYDELAKLS